jgi:hypothetical protein
MGVGPVATKKRLCPGIFVEKRWERNRVVADLR